MKRFHALAAGAIAMFAACAGRDAAPPVDAPVRQLSAGPREAGDLPGRCRPFAANFAESAACQRADGTLRTFASRRVAWRVRYFVRYWEMPCGEAPTRDESYVFQMTTRDLYGDADLIGVQRRAIRAAMFAGPVRCP